MFKQSFNKSRNGQHHSNQKSEDSHVSIQIEDSENESHKNDQNNKGYSSITEDQALQLQEQLLNLKDQNSEIKKLNLG